MFSQTSFAASLAIVSSLIGGSLAGAPSCASLTAGTCELQLNGMCTSGDSDICGGSAWSNYEIYSGSCNTKVAEGSDPTKGQAIDSSLPYTVDITELSGGGSWKTAAFAYGATDVTMSCTYLDQTDTLKYTTCTGNFAC